MKRLIFILCLTFAIPARSDEFPDDLAQPPFQRAYRTTIHPRGDLDEAFEYINLLCICSCDFETMKNFWRFLIRLIERGENAETPYTYTE